MRGMSGQEISAQIWQPKVEKSRKTVWVDTPSMMEHLPIQKK